MRKNMDPLTGGRSPIVWVILGAAQILLVIAAFMGGFLFHEWHKSGTLFPALGRYPLLNEAKAILETNAYAPLPDDTRLEYGMIRGMLQAYNDPYTTFVEPPQHELQQNQLEGKFGGIGVRIERDSENLVYLYPLPGSSALAAGLQEGDRLLKVDRMDISPATTNDEIQAAVRGEIGSTVTVTVGRPPDYTPLELKILRAEVALPSLTWNLAPDEARVGVVRVNVVADTTPQELTNAIQDLQSRGATHFVLDLRNNGGGLVEAGVNTARLFLSSGSVIEQQYRDKPVRAFTVEEPGPFASLPLVILVNENTASAAEIIAGALQGQHRAPLVGTRTYGKDSIQLIFNLADGSSLHVSAAKWWVPGLFPAIGANGLQPDVAVDASTDPDAAMQIAIQKALE